MLRAKFTRIHGVFAPNSKHPILATPAKRGKGNKLKGADETRDQIQAERRAALIWVQRLKQAFNIETCRKWDATHLEDGLHAVWAQNWG